MTDSALAALRSLIANLPSPAATDDPIATSTAAFLAQLSGQALSDSAAANETHLARLYRDGGSRMTAELNQALTEEPGLGRKLTTAAGTLQVGGRSPDMQREALWSVFFPEGTGTLGREEERIAELRSRRAVNVEHLNPRPIADPAREILFTSNVLLTVPAAGIDIESLPYPADMRRRLREAAAERQLYWFDHPIQIGVEPRSNELLYGLRGLDRAMAFERRRNPTAGRLTVVLSVSVTHAGLREVAHEFVRHELERAGGLEHLDVHVFTETDAERLLEEVLEPAVDPLARDSLRDVFGVDGEYGRHYSFLKAITALWQVLVDPGVRGTFKIDLDQVFPQEALVAETGHSALEHLATRLWGARGVDADGQPVELGMIAGALVNERDIGRGLFTPDVPLPIGPATPDEHVFMSKLPQAISTRAEMMTRYGGPELDGRRRALQRVHVTGGTNGILVDALRRHRPFTPSFIGRAEDQAYIMSLLGDANAGKPRLAYAHAAGLIMRHDKEAFAGEAIEAARVGKLVGDDVRILYFSALGRTVGFEQAKALLDPFTGCFISRLPITVVLLRSALRIGNAFASGDAELGRQLAEIGSQRIAFAISSTVETDDFRRRVARERQAWDAYYAGLQSVEASLVDGDEGALRLRRRARDIVAAARLDARVGRATD